MSPWHEKKNAAWPLYAGAAVIVVAGLAGLLLMTGVISSDDEPGGSGGTTPTAAPSATAVPSSSPRPSAAPADEHLEVASWGQSGGQLAVVVRNSSKETVDQARVRITAKDASGGLVLSTTGTPSDVCCTVVGLAPGEEFALFADPVRDAEDVKSVEVAAVDAETSPAPVSASVQAGAARIERTSDDTVVTVALTARGRFSGYVAAQAVLVDAEDRVVQVISGRFYCFAPGKARTVRMHLFHTVPAGVRVREVLAQPVPEGTPGLVPGRCG